MLSIKIGGGAEAEWGQNLSKFQSGRARQEVAQGKVLIETEDN